MAKRSKNSRPSGEGQGKPSRRASGVGVARARSGQGWVLTHPPCVREAAEDLEEVRAMIAAGETDVAVDELRWLVSACTEMIEAHFLLGKLAAETAGDLPLARGHFGFGYELGAKAIARAGNAAPLAALHPANRPFFDAGRGLAWCLNELDKRDIALEVLAELLRCDPTDPLGLRGWIDEINTRGAPIVELGAMFPQSPDAPP
jgi:hypothetical protein